jgi:hypothetical protein
MKRLVLVPSLAAVLAVASPALAGPPFITDDPEPTDLGKWEIYNFANGIHIPGDTSGQAGLDLNYGGAKDLQLTAVFPAGYDSTSAGTSWGSGDIELAAKYKFLHQDGPVGLDVAVFPRVFLPSAFNRASNDRHASLLLPLWAEKDWGKWSVYGGGGYTINPGTDNRSYWLGGIVLQRQLSERAFLGLEFYRQGATTREGKSQAFATLGGGYKFTKHWSLIADAGPGLENQRTSGQSEFYIALKADY